MSGHIDNPYVTQNSILDAESSQQQRVSKLKADRRRVKRLSQTKWLNFFGNRLRKRAVSGMMPETLRQLTIRLVEG